MGLHVAINELQNREDQEEAKAQFDLLAKLEGWENPTSLDLTLKPGTREQTLSDLQQTPEGDFVSRRESSQQSLQKVFGMKSADMEKEKSEGFITAKTPARLTKSPSA